MRVTAVAAAAALFAALASVIRPRRKPQSSANDGKRRVALAVTGSVASPDVTLNTALAKMAPNAARDVTNWSTAGFAVVSGPAEGLLMQVASSGGRKLVLQEPLPVSLIGNSSNVTVIP